LSPPAPGRKKNPGTKNTKRPDDVPVLKPALPHCYSFFNKKASWV
jgi:hypothetical protein